MVVLSKGFTNRRPNHSRQGTDKNDGQEGQGLK